MFLNTLLGRFLLLTYSAVHIIMVLAPYYYKTEQKRKLLMSLSVTGAMYAGLLFTWVENDFILTLFIIVGLLSGGMFYFIGWSMLRMEEDQTHKIALPGNPKISAAIIAFVYALGLGWLLSKAYLVQELQVDCKVIRGTGTLI